MYILASSKYQEAVYVVPPIASSIFFIFMYSIYANIEFYFDANKFTAMISMVGAVLNLILNFICIPLFGYIAASYTSLGYVLNAVDNKMKTNDKYSYRKYGYKSYSLKEK